MNELLGTGRATAQSIDYYLDGTVQFGGELLTLRGERLKLRKLNPACSITQGHDCLSVSEATIRMKNAKSQRIVRDEVARNEQLFCPSKLGGKIFIDLARMGLKKLPY